MLSEELIQLDKDNAICVYGQSTKNGFKHVAVWYENGQVKGKTSVSYQNRT